MKGLHDFTEEKESGTANSDSGVHTEEVVTLPEIAASPSHDNEARQIILKSVSKEKRLKTRSRRESELLLDHETIVNDMQNLTVNIENNIVDGATALLLPENTQLRHPNEVAQQIEILEKIVAINKHLQKEEELLVRLGAKIKRYEADATGLSEQQVKDALDRVNVQLTDGDEKLIKLDDDIKHSDVLLHEKSNELKKLYDELEEFEVENNRLTVGPDALLSADQIYEKLPLTTNPNLNLSREYLAENLYNVSKTFYLSQSEFQVSDVECSDMFVHPIQPPSEFRTPYTQTLAHAQIHTINEPKTVTIPSISNKTLPSTMTVNNSNTNKNTQPKLFSAITKSSSPSHINQLNPNNLLASMNYLSLNKFNQRNINNVMCTSTNLKLGPKKLINGVTVHDTSSGASNSSDTGVSSISEQDFTQLGTLV